MRKIGDVVRKNQSEILSTWLHRMPSSTRRTDLISESEIRTQSSDYLKALEAGLQQEDNANDLSKPEWATMRDLLTEISGSRVRLGFTPSQIARFVFSSKEAIVQYLRNDLDTHPEILAEEIYWVSLLIDELGLYSVDVFQRAQAEIIRAQQQEMLELSTPVLSVWEGILVLPLIGTLDSTRTQTVMETLLEKIVTTGCQVAIIDITGVPTVDTLVAQYLMKTVTAAKLMGAECLISGIRPQIAQTMVHLGLQMTEIITKARLSDALVLALSRTGRRIA